MQKNRAFWKISEFYSFFYFYFFLFVYLYLYYLRRHTVVSNIDLENVVVVENRLYFSYIQAPEWEPVFLKKIIL